MPDMMSQKEEFLGQREKQNEIVMKYANQPIKRYFSLDNQTYREGALTVREKEMLGLVASLVLRCDDCIKYHIIKCHEAGVTSEELAEALNVGVVVGGTITIPHLRRALSLWDELEAGD